MSSDIPQFDSSIESRKTRRTSQVLFALERNEVKAMPVCCFLCGNKVSDKNVEFYIQQL